MSVSLRVWRGDRPAVTRGGRGITHRGWRCTHGLDRRAASVRLLRRRARAVVGEAPGDRDPMGDLRRIRETRLAHERRDALSEVVSQALASVVEASQETVGAHLLSSEVKQVQRAAGFEYPPCLVQRVHFLFWTEVVEHQGG